MLYRPLDSLAMHCSGKLLTPLRIKGVASSSAVHGSAIVAGLALAWLLPASLEKPEFAGSVQSIRLEATFVQPEQPLIERMEREMPVVVMPRQAQIEERLFVQTETRAVRPEDLDLVLSQHGLLPSSAFASPLPREDEVAQVDAAAAAPARQPSEARPVVTLPHVPQVAGTEDKTPPRFHNNQPPTYPAEAIRRRLEGEALLRVSIAASGRVEHVEIARSSGHPILDASAVTAVRRWTGEPARLGGRPVATVELLPVQFRLPTR